jgi:hypothetical protein
MTILQCKFQWPIRLLIGLLWLFCMAGPAGAQSKTGFAPASAVHPPQRASAAPSAKVAAVPPAGGAAKTGPFLTRFQGVHQTHWGTSGSELANAKVEGSIDNAQHGVMGSHIVTLRLANGKQVRGIFKPIDGEKDWGEYKKGTLYQREIAASRLSDELGFHIVPPTIETTVNGQKGSLQLWVENASTANLVHDQFHMDRARRELMTVFDYLISNTDRHGGNWLVRHNGQSEEPVAIDHGLSFPSNSAVVTAPPPHLQNLRPETRALLAQSSPERIARALVKTGLDGGAVTGAINRLELVRAANGGPPASTPQQVQAWVTAANATTAE